MGLAITLLFNFSRTRWQSTSIPLVRSWNTRYEAIWIATWLSQYIIKGTHLPLIPQVGSHDVWAMALYSTFALDQEMTLCFLFFQVIKFPPRKVQSIVVDLWFEGDLDRSESVNVSHKWPLALYKSQWPRCAFRYFTVPRIDQKIKWVTRSYHILTHNTHCKWYLWMSNGEIVQLAN